MRLIDLAMKANISATWLWFTENGYDKRVSKGIKERIAAALGCEYGTVFPGEAESEAHHGRD